jgi:hypothetical protein
MSVGKMQEADLNIPSLYIAMVLVLATIGRTGLSIPDHAFETGDVQAVVVDHDRDAEQGESVHGLVCSKSRAQVGRLSTAGGVETNFVRLIRFGFDEQANIGIGVPSMTKAAINAATSGSLPPYSLKSPLLSRTMGETKSKSPAQRQQEARDDAAAAAKESSSLLAFPSMFGSSITNYLLGIFDSPAYGNLTTHFMQGTFNPSTPDDPNVKYLSVAGRTNKMSVLHPLWFPKLILDAAAERGYAEERGKSGKSMKATTVWSACPVPSGESGWVPWTTVITGT